MKKFTLNFVVKTHISNLEYMEKIVVSVKKADWEIFKREGFKIKNKTLLFPSSAWQASFRPACCPYAIYIGVKRKNSRKLITIDEPTRENKKCCWKVLDCCR